MNYGEHRQRLLDWVRKQLIGPAGCCTLQVSPLERYPTGVLHPVEPGLSGTDPASAPDAEAGEANLLEDSSDEEHQAAGDREAHPTAQPARRRRYVPPSSAGFSICVDGPAKLLITAAAAFYKAESERDAQGRFLAPKYQRENLDEVSVTWTDDRDPTWDIWKGRAGIDIRVRPHAIGTILTVTLLNKHSLDPEATGRQRTTERIEHALFETRLTCRIEEGTLLEYPRIDPSLLTDEELELELQYRERRIYAVGHGAAVDWRFGEDGIPSIETEFMPATEVPPVSVKPRGDHDDALSMTRLADNIPLDALDRFVAGYGQWLAERRTDATAFDDQRLRSAAERICSRMDVAYQRMQGGIELLRSDSDAASCFALANRAMLAQMRNSRRLKARDNEPQSSDKPEEPAWRPFQLAFLLTTIESAVMETDPFRDILDLIWFPTGGGKTEAYLGLIAFLVAWRRRKYGDEGGGTVALMRYTLRLLTRQQFERAAGVIFALELLRRGHTELLGDEPISVGMWVGSAISPNTCAEAYDAVRDIVDGKPNAPQELVIDRCLWCHAKLASDPCHSYVDTERGFSFRCPNPECEFGQDHRALPCNVVDEALYEQPPTVLIGTIDKFARLAWEPRAAAFFGARKWPDSNVRPPELIIQDELHLVTGPLGSVAGLYEAGLDALLGSRGVRPKYIASTATIRRASEQVERLYGRDLAVFPPPGLSCDDSWFARTDRDRPGRLYVGYLAPALDQQHSLAPLAAVLLAAPESLYQGERDEGDLRDAWWTLIAYHGSLRGVGNSHNLMVTDIRYFGRRLYAEMVEQSQSGDELEDESERESEQEQIGGAPRFENTRINQLTSLRTAQENAQTFQRLALGHEDEGYLDVVLATNMVSVGLDVERLALMIVNGQPLTTAEYIQATSRVGRATVPGLVFANYYRHQARSLSHYETFRPYHESFYRFVEPTSVTPFTFQVRSRALHAALVIALRHGCPELRDNKSAGDFDPHAPNVRTVIEALKRRCKAAEAGDGKRDISAHIDRLVAEWADEAERCRRERRQLKYQAPNRVRNAERLLYGHGETIRGLWPTLHSMRSVESTGMFRVRG